MSKAKKFLLIAFTVGLVINLQFNAPLTRNMDKGFSIEQLAENIFVPEAFASYSCKAKSGCGHVECTGINECTAYDHSVCCDNHTSTCMISH